MEHGDDSGRRPVAGIESWGVLAAATALTVLAVGCGTAAGEQLPKPPPPKEPDPCIGAKPPDSAWGVEPSAPAPPGDTSTTGPALGALAPAWKLTDFQPQSCGYEATYGPEVFQGRPTIIAIWSGG